MTKIISAKLAGNTLLGSFGLLAVFHVLVLVGVVPATIVWGGQVGASPESLLVAELIALAITALFAVIVASRTGYLKADRFRTATKIGVWLIFAYLLLNTLGNLASAVSIENLIFAPLTVLLALCALRLALEK